MEKNNSEYKKYKLFANIGKLITSSLDSKTILEKIMLEVKLYFNPQHWSLIRFDHTSNYLYFAMIEGTDYEKIKHIKLKPNEGIVGEVVSSGKSIFVPDTSKDTRFNNKVDKQTGFKTETIIAVPIKINDIVYGVIEVINHENHSRFIEDDHLILQSIADFAAIAFYNNSLYEEALLKSEMDGLTGLYNRNKLNKIILKYTEQVQDQRRNKDKSFEIIAIFIDLNKFKDVNDNFGHQEGDEILKKVALSLRSIFRREDQIFRIGGDEFLVLITVEDSMDAKVIINRIDNVLKTLKISSLDYDYAVGVSFGIKTGLCTNIKSIINEADQIMYNSKLN